MSNDEILEDYELIKEYDFIINLLSTDSNNNNLNRLISDFVLHISFTNERTLQTIGRKLNDFRREIKSKLIEEIIDYLDEKIQTRFVCIPENSLCNKVINHKKIYGDILQT